MIAAILFCGSGPGEPETPYEKSGRTATATWEEAIAYYEALAGNSAKIKVLEAGMTDIGKPLHLVLISGDGTFDAGTAKRKDKRVILINNGIHPGEPDGIDASMMLARDLISSSNYEQLLENTVILIIPVYNVDGCLNRGCCSRANQNGPVEYGFRGNAKNLDLNRDFIKMDSKNAESFEKIFREWDPDVFVDTHTSDGADYPYIMTILPTQKDKLHPEVSAYMTRLMLPELYKRMLDAGFEMCPYVNTVAEIPDSGIADFFDSPRFSTGYAALFHTIGITTESHMLKTFEQRVEATYMLLMSIIKTVHRDRVAIRRARETAKIETATQSVFPTRWKLQEGRSEMMLFKGYEAEWITSLVTGLPVLRYNQSRPWTREIPHFNVFNTDASVEKPFAYIIPQAWKEVVERMKVNKVKMNPLLEDTKLDCEFYFIDSYQTRTYPYEGHYEHYQVKLKKENREVQFYKGDIVVITNQESNRYIVETLEPESHDSWFAWGFFDATLMRKEYFSDYVFDAEAEKILAEDAALKAKLDEMRATDSAFAGNAWMQLDFVYRNTGHYENSHNRYPVARLINQQKLPIGKP